MDDVVFMTEILTHLRRTMEDITFLLSSNTNVIHAYAKYGEIARLELLKGNQGGVFVHLKSVSRRFEDKVIRIEPNKIRVDDSEGS